MAHEIELIYVRATVPDVMVHTVEQVGATLPRGWDDVPAPAVDAALGDALAHAVRSLALYVASVLIPIETPERNVLINPLHPGFSHIVWTVNEFLYDRRFSRHVLADHPAGAVSRGNISVLQPRR